MAEMEVKGAIRKALKPAAFQDGPKTSRPALFRASKHGESHHHPFYSEDSEFPEWHMCEWNFLNAKWPSTALAEDYDMTVMAGPLLPKDADKGLLAGEDCCLCASPPLLSPSTPCRQLFPCSPSPAPLGSLALQHQLITEPEHCRSFGPMPIICTSSSQ